MKGKEGRRQIDIIEGYLGFDKVTELSIDVPLVTLMLKADAELLLQYDSVSCPFPAPDMSSSFKRSMTFPVTHVIAIVSDAPPGSLPQHQQVHLRLHWARAAQRLPAPVGGLSGMGVPDGQV